MSRLHVEGWAPDYGSPLETDESFAPADVRIDTEAETTGSWEPITGADDGVRIVVFVDGVRRVDARLTIDEPAGPIPGLCGTYGVGALRWDREQARAEVTDVSIDRLAVFTNGRVEPMPVLPPPLRYRSEAVPDSDPAALIRRFHDAMRRSEAALAERLADSGCFVVADGPINDMSATPKIGYIKSHRVPYLPAELSPIIGRLEPGWRTPMFVIGGDGPYRRYSWYLRLARLVGGHTWTGVVRCEASTNLGVDAAAALADRSAAVLPLVGSEAHIDPRAPQNLVPIAALERDLRRRMGEPTYVHRQLRFAVANDTSRRGVA